MQIRTQCDDDGNTLGRVNGDYGDAVAAAAGVTGT